MRRTFALFLILLSQPGIPSDTASGLKYQHQTRSGPLSIHILVVDPSRVSIQAARALNEGIGRETVTSIAARTGALAGVNGGFFRMGGRYDGEPDGILKIRDQWFSDPALRRGAIGWRDGGRECLFGRIKMKWLVTVDGKSLPVDGINRPREPAEAILYDWAFHRSTLTDPGGLEVRIAGNRVTALEERGDSAIPANGFVYSIGPKSSLRNMRLRMKSTAKVSYRLEPDEPSAPDLGARWQRMDFIVGGVPILMRDGRLLNDWQAEGARQRFAEKRHPRTAVGLRPDGAWVFAVVDGRQPSLSIGMTLKELADTMASLGCVSALNLDGGGSSAMILDGRLMNSPSDAGKERPVSDAIMIMPHR
jgi:hypothetical protein